MRTPAITERDNFIWLLLSLMVLFFLSALFDQLDNAALGRAVGGLISVTVLVAVWSLEEPRFALVARWGVAVLVVGFLALEWLLQYSGLALLQLIFLLLCSIATVVICCRQVLFAGYVDGNKIIGAICIYMLLGVVWALSYLLVEQLFPGSLPGLSGADWREQLQEALYFSIVTLTTLGYGDMSPVQPLGRYLAFMQALTGQFYTAILVASLIGVRLADRERS
tara:strand:- start:92117 stop:92785 length:669 start_codon:yes stop_codon:yes gene_type:complete